MNQVQSTPDVNSALQQTVVIIPARNEGQSIGLVLKELPEVAAVIVVNNGSTDETAEVAEQFGCVVVDEPIPGYGRACLTGMSMLQSMVANGLVDASYVGFIDADYSDHPQELVGMMETMCDQTTEAGRVDFVLGSRMIGKREQGAMPPQAMFGNWLACNLMRLIWRTKYTDLGPFRVIRYDKLMALGMQDLNFGWTIEMQIKATLAGLVIKEVPAQYRRRIGVSKISGTVTGTFKAGYKILYTIAKFAVKTKRPKQVPMCCTLTRTSARKVA